MQEQLSPGSPALIRSAGILFPEPGLCVDINQAIPWEPVHRSHKILSTAERQNQLSALVQEILLRRADLEGSSLLSWLVDPKAGRVNAQKASHAVVQQLSAAYQDNQVEGVQHCLAALLGQGSGLTPAGDDLISGFLLALSRWGDLLAPGFPLQAVVNSIRPGAYQNTTLLSVNLIECAAEGLADERLLFALDGLMTGVPDYQAAAQFLLGWGNSSGSDALCGMAIALSRHG